MLYSLIIFLFLAWKTTSGTLFLESAHNMYVCVCVCIWSVCSQHPSTLTLSPWHQLGQGPRMPAQGGNRQAPLVSHVDHFKFALLLASVLEKSGGALALWPMLT